MLQNFGCFKHEEKLINAGLTVQCETLTERIFRLDQGYQRIEEKVTRLGASVRRVR